LAFPSKEIITKKLEEDPFHEKEHVSLDTPTLVFCLKHQPTLKLGNWKHVLIYMTNLVIIKVLLNGIVLKFSK